MKKIIYIFLAGFLIAGCQRSQENDAEQVRQEISEEPQSDEEIMLNNGSKWLVNDEMKPFIKSGEETLENYIANQDGNNQVLADKLKAENDSLIKSCTMTGKSHEELHKWLHPHLELVAALKKADNSQAADKIIHELKASFDLYHQYFE